ncbi:hypothetical protein FRB97_004651, partial [Tulasnella sp. 331]
MHLEVEECASGEESIRTREDEELEECYESMKCTMIHPGIQDPQPFVVDCTEKNCNDILKHHYHQSRGKRGRDGTINT